MLSKLLKKSGGFTLIEVLVAIFLITTGVLGAMVMVNQIITFNQVTSSRLVAAYLAQEGIEIVKNIRDTNFLEEHNRAPEDPPISWNRGLSIGTHYNFDYRSMSIPDANCSGKNYLKLVGNFYQCSDEILSQKLQRKVTISKPDTPDCPADDCLEVLVEVSWEERGRSHQVSAQENLYKWW